MGEFETPNELQCIFFSQERRKEGIKLAQKMQGQGERVVLQDISGVKNLDAFSKKFSNTIYLMEKAGKEPADECFTNDCNAKRTDF